MDVDKLSKGQLQMLRRAFDAFEVDGKIPTTEISTILEMLGKPQSDSSMAFLIDEFDPWNSGKLEFDTFKELAARYLTEDENPEAMQQELREAFRLYDKEAVRVCEFNETCTMAANITHYKSQYHIYQYRLPSPLLLPSSYRMQGRQAIF